MQEYGREFRQITLITQGNVELKTEDGLTFMRLPPNSLFGDYQLIFKLRSNIRFVAAVEKQKSFSKDSKVDQIQPNIMTMQCKEEVFDDLCELYPETAANIKMRGLEKRDVFKYYMDLAKARENGDEKIL